MRWITSATPTSKRSPESRVDPALRLIGRDRHLFAEELERHGADLRKAVAGASFLVIGGAGSIGQAVVKELFQRSPAALHVVDISENNLVELVRDIRSSYGYIEGDFRTYALDAGSAEFRALLAAGPRYDYVLNLSALKHVRSEKDPYTLMRMVEVNVLNTVATLAEAERMGAKKYFCVSTDKATNPVSMMGASKRIMELYLLNASLRAPVSTARFANVAFSDGSLLHGFAQRIAKGQPLSAPRDVRRYFITQEESGVLCTMSCLFGDNRDIFFPKLDPKAHLLTFSEIARRYLESLGFEAEPCATEEEARDKARHRTGRHWPCYFFDSDTTGEKPFEEFYVEGQDIDSDRYPNIGVIRNRPYEERQTLERFTAAIAAMRAKGTWDKQEMVALFKATLPEFEHFDTGKYLDDRM
jgi:UDP-N-acetylglucosamine 4,6-dehydratase